MKYNRYRNFAAVSLMIVSSLFATSLMAEQDKPLLDNSLVSIGVGLSTNSVSGPVGDKVGFQLFGGYDLKQFKLADGVFSAVEIGFMDYGFDGNSNGIWATYLAKGVIEDQLSWLGRLGMDFGDDSGVMLGAGLDYRINIKMNIRGEYVIRDDVGSLQVNFVYHL